MFHICVRLHYDKEKKNIERRRETEFLAEGVTPYAAIPGLQEMLWDAADVEEENFCIFPGIETERNKPQKLPTDFQYAD